MDRKLKYIEHGKDINRKILGRWVMICKHTNRNWGFKQHVIVRLLEVLIATCIHYAGVVWINPHSIKEVEKLCYKIINSTVGAVFNIKTSLAEAILGVQPITVSNKINSIKHLLKLNIFHDTDDPMKQFVTSHLRSFKHSKLTKKLKYTFTFLNWKTTMYEKSFTDIDLEIIRNLEYERFAELSTRSCCYSKLVIKCIQKCCGKKVWINNSSWTDLMIPQKLAAQSSYSLPILLEKSKLWYLASYIQTT